MKLQIDTKNKTIKVDEEVNLGELSEVLLKLFPKLEWKEYKLVPNIVIQEKTLYPDTNPLTPSPWTTPETGRPWWQWFPDTVTYTADQINGMKIDEIQTVYNIEI